MSKPDSQEPILPLFHLTEKFPDAKAIFSTPIPSLEDFKKNALIVLDTNVLLIPYLIQPKSIDDIKNTYEFLISENRLFIPAQVAREFAKNRGEKIQNLYHEITLKQNINVKKVDYKLLEPFAEYGELTKLEEELTTKIKEYRKIVGNVLTHIKSWRWNDPVSKLYQDLFTPELIIETSKTTKEIEVDLERRIANRISPGFKDSSKDDRGIGDVIIWNTILELGIDTKKPLIFVTGDEKNDWMLRSSDEALYPNFELIEEFSRVSNGQPFHILKFSELLNLFDVKKEVVEEVKSEELETKYASINARNKSHHVYLTAEKSFFNWLLNRYSVDEIIVTERSPIDYIVNSVNGESYGYIVKSSIRPRSLRFKLLDSIVNAVEIQKKTGLDKIALVIVCSEEEKIDQYFDIFERFLNERFGIIIGYLDELNMFRGIYDSFH